MSNKRIEDIFSSLEHLQSTPPPELWENISDQLDEPKKRKGLGIWWALAASLLLTSGISLINYLRSTNEVTVPSEIKISNASFDKAKVLQNQTRNSLSKAESKNKDSNLTPNTDNSKIANVNDSISIYSKSEKSSLKIKRNQIVSNHTYSQTSVLGQQSKGQSKNATKIRTNGTINNDDDKTAESYDRLAVENTPMPLYNKTETLHSMTAKSTINSENIALSTSALTNSDSLQLAELERLDSKINKNKDKDPEEKTKINKEKWSINVFAGMANSQNLTNEKTLGYSNDSKKSNSYGVKTNYKLTKKWAVSSGLKVSEIGQSNNNVSYSSISSSASMTNNGDFEFSQSLPLDNTVSSSAEYLVVSETATSVIKNSSFEKGALDKSLRYLEVPLEISYSLFEKSKTSILLNTGGFVGKLISNQVLLNGDKIGNNVGANEFVYGSVLSSTVQYKIFNKTNLFVEPGMNYYLNPLNNQSFNQFQWMLNFGLNVSF